MKKNKKVAFCIDIPEFQSNQILDKYWASKFPGSGWVSFLYDLLKNKNICIATGEMAINHIKTGYWKAKDVLIIQELNSSQGFILRKLGAKPFIQCAHESPLYAYSFYSWLIENYKIFPERFLFSGNFGSIIPKKIYGNNTLYFPSYDTNNIGKINAWNTRKNIVLVAANKYYAQPNKIPLSLNPKIHLRWFRDLYKKLTSAVYLKAKSLQLHDKRLELVKFFLDTGDLEIFGSGWNDESRLPKKKWNYLKSSLPKKNIELCTDKQNVMSHYRFAICFENVSYPGYVTEKIIDCFVAGVIPIYYGAPDISDFIPSSLFIDASKFDSTKLLKEHLNSISEKEAILMIKSAKKFLTSKAGKNFSYQNFARKILSLILKEIELDES